MSNLIVKSHHGSLRVGIFFVKNFHAENAKKLRGRRVRITSSKNCLFGLDFISDGVQYEIIMMKDCRSVIWLTCSTHT